MGVFCITRKGEDGERKRRRRRLHAKNFLGCLERINSQKKKCFFVAVFLLQTPASLFFYLPCANKYQPRQATPRGTVSTRPIWIDRGGEGGGEELSRFVFADLYELYLIYTLHVCVHYLIT
jgi:hypothetical protein